MTEAWQSVPQGRLNLAPGLRPISVNLPGMFFRQNSRKIVILSEAPHRFIA
jgi:hypothetical protein